MSPAQARARIAAAALTLTLLSSACAGPVSTTSPTSHQVHTGSTSPPPSSLPTTSSPAAEVPPTPADGAESEEGPSCRPDPFSEIGATELATRYPAQQLTAHVYDARTGCEYSLNPGNRQPTASVFKILVMAGTLVEAQSQSREPTEWEWSQLEPMITMSANSPVRALWGSFGAAPWFSDQVALFGLEDTTVRADDGSAWGLTLTSAQDQVLLLRQVLLGEWGPLGSRYRQYALELMSSVVQAQTWGVTSGVPLTWAVVQKNGFAGVTINSVGWVDQPGSSPGYVVAILSTGWPNHPAGIAAVEFVSQLVASAMIDSVEGAR